MRDWTRGIDIDQLTAHVDVFPTLIDLCNLESPEGVAFDGQSLEPLLFGNAIKSEDRVIIVDSQRKDIPVKWRKSAVMTQQWRLINGEELYNIQQDSGQRDDIATQFPEVVTKLKEDYEKWWEDVSVRFDDFCYHILGNEAENPYKLTSHDWHGAEHPDGTPYLNNSGEETPPTNQWQVREPRLANGYWVVEVETDGKYEFELCRWPKEADAAMTAGLPGKPAVPGGNPYPEGKSLSIRKARLKIGEVEVEKALEPQVKSAKFTVDLKAGQANLKTWLTGDEDLSLGAYYVYVTKL